MCIFQCRYLGKIIINIFVYFKKYVYCRCFCILFFSIHFALSIYSLEWYLVMQHGPPAVFMAHTNTLPSKWRLTWFLLSHCHIHHSDSSHSYEFHTFLTIVSHSLHLAMCIFTMNKTQWNNSKWEFLGWWKFLIVASIKLLVIQMIEWLELEITM